MKSLIWGMVGALSVTGVLAQDAADTGPFEYKDSYEALSPTGNSMAGGAVRPLETMTLFAGLMLEAAKPEETAVDLDHLRLVGLSADEAKEMPSLCTSMWSINGAYMAEVEHQLVSIEDESIGVQTTYGFSSKFDDYVSGLKGEDLVVHGRLAERCSDYFPIAFVPVAFAEEVAKLNVYLEISGAKLSGVFKDTSGENAQVPAECVSSERLRGYTCGVCVTKLLGKESADGPCQPVSLAEFTKASALRDMEFEVTITRRGNSETIYMPFSFPSRP